MSDRPLTEDDFWAVMSTPVVAKPVFYRLYHNDDGTPICYSMEELPHNYIELTLEQYRLSPPNVRVVNGQMVVVKPSSYVRKLIPSKTGTPCDPRDVCIVVEESKPHIKWNVKHNETD